MSYRNSSFEDASVTMRYVLTQANKRQNRLQLGGISKTKVLNVKDFLIVKLSFIFPTLLLWNVSQRKRYSHP